MAKFDLKAVWADIKAYRQVYILTAIASFGGMVCVALYTRNSSCNVANNKMDSSSDGTLDSSVVF